MIDLGHSKITELENGLVEIICKDEFMYDIEQITENHSVLEKISQKKGEPILVYSVTGKYTGITSEASYYVNQGPHASFIRAEAFIIHSTTQRLLASLYFIKIRKPVVPAAYFTKVTDAEHWLMKFRIKK
ncbi:MAG: hypothetical protein KA163_00085 [Bacteroidia bacterium]|nr:hypothetical protein [Bacteroidia bacterium]